MPERASDDRHMSPIWRLRLTVREVCAQSVPMKPTETRRESQTPRRSSGAVKSRRPLLDLPGAAAHLGVPERTMRTLRDTRQVATVRVGRYRMFDPDHLDEYRDQQTEPAVA